MYAKKLTETPAHNLQILTTYRPVYSCVRTYVRPINTHSSTVLSQTTTRTGFAASLGARCLELTS